MARYESIYEYESSLVGEGLAVGIVMSRFNQPICEGLLSACVIELRKFGVADCDIEIATVHGALEIPLALQTMAQSFAGVGYQIQGIRSRVLKGERIAQTQITDQLDVAYQLVRRCHEEASRTISMLGTASPEVQNVETQEIKPAVSLEPSGEEVPILDLPTPDFKWLPKSE